MKSETRTRNSLIQLYPTALSLDNPVNHFAKKSNKA